MTPILTILKSRLAADGWSASSPVSLDPEGERLAREDRRDR